MWERSFSLKREDRLLHALFTVAIEELIVLGPPLAALVFASQQFRATAWQPAHWWLLGAIAGNVTSIGIGVLMLKDHLQATNKSELDSLVSRIENPA